MTLARVLTFAVVVTLAVAGLVVLSRTACRDGTTAVERRVDSTLATEPAWRDTVRARDSVIAANKREAARLKKLSADQRTRADQAEAKADSLQQWADDLAEVPTNIGQAEQNIRLRTALAAQKQASAQLRVTIGDLKAQRSTDSLRLEQADRTIAEQNLWRSQDQVKIAKLYEDLNALRAEGKRRGKFLGFLPPWADEALMVAGTAVVAYKVGKAS